LYASAARLRLSGLCLAEQLGSINAAAAELGTTRSSLRNAFQRHRLGCPHITLRRDDLGHGVRSAASLEGRRRAVDR